MNATGRRLGRLARALAVLVLAVGAVLVVGGATASADHQEPPAPPPPSDVEDLVAVAEGPTTIRVTWDLVPDQLEGILAVRITSDVDGPWTFVMEPVETYTWSEATPDTAYTVGVQTCTGYTPLDITCGEPSFTTVTTPPAVAPGAPILTEVEASAVYLTDPCCFAVAEIEWAVDPSGPAPTRYTVEYLADGYQSTHHLAASATDDFDMDLPADTDVQITLTACAGPPEAEACAQSVHAVHTPSAVEPSIGVVGLTATALSPTTFDVTWGAQSNIGVAIMVITITSDDPPTNHFDAPVSPPYTFTAAVPGKTYTVEVAVCGGPSPSTLQCGASSTTVTMPIGTGTLAGSVTDGSAAPVAGATVAAYAPTDGWFPTASTTTGADGSYTFDDLPVGQYAVVAKGPAGSSTGLSWHGGPTRGSATLVTVEADGTTSGVDVTLPTSASIGGVVSLDGAPLAGSTVWAFAPEDRWIGTALTTTAADGSYRIDGLEPGTYQVVVVPAGGAPPPQWYGGATRPEAIWVEVTVGGDVVGIDLALTT